MRNDYEQTLKDAGFSPSAAGWERMVGKQVQTLQDSRAGDRVVWFAHAAELVWRMDAARVQHHHTTGGGFICCAPDPVTAMVYADIERWEFGAQREFTNCIRIGFGHE